MLSLEVKGLLGDPPPRPALHMYHYPLPPRPVSLGAVRCGEGGRGSICSMTATAPSLTEPQRTVTAPTQRLPHLRATRRAKMSAYRVPRCLNLSVDTTGTSRTFRSVGFKCHAIGKIYFIRVKTKSSKKLTTRVEASASRRVGTRQGRPGLDVGWTLERLRAEGVGFFAHS